MTYTNCIIVIGESRKELKDFLECLKIGCKRLYRLNGIWTYAIRENLEAEKIAKTGIEILTTDELLDKMESMRQYCPTKQKHIS